MANVILLFNAYKSPESLFPQAASLLWANHMTNKNSRGGIMGSEVFLGDMSAELSAVKAFIAKI